MVTDILPSKKFLGTFHVHYLLGRGQIAALGAASYLKLLLDRNEFI